MAMNMQEKLREERAKESKEIIKNFLNDTKSEEVLIVVLKAHLYIERELIKLLTESIIDEKILNGTTFRQKLDLANSMGLVEGFYGALGKVNSIRNGYAHNIEYKFNEQIYEDLISTLAKEDKEDFLEEYDEWKTLIYDGKIPELNFKLQILLSYIWFALIIFRIYAKTALEFKLKQKEFETMEKYAVRKKELENIEQ